MSLYVLGGDSEMASFMQLTSRTKRIVVASADEDFSTRAISERIVCNQFSMSRWLAGSLRRKAGQVGA